MFNCSYILHETYTVLPVLF